MHCYRLHLVVDVLSGETPEEIAHDWVRRHGDVVEIEVLTDEGKGQETDRAADGPGAGPPGVRVDA